MFTVVELVKKLGPRNVLVTTEGKVEGIITRKDLAQHIHKLEKVGGVPHSFVKGREDSVASEFIS